VLVLALARRDPPPRSSAARPLPRSALVLVLATRETPGTLRSPPGN
jgi:hypothetical protein